MGVPPYRLSSDDGLKWKRALAHCVLLYTHQPQQVDITYMFSNAQSEAVVRGLSSLSTKWMTCISDQSRPFHWLFHFQLALHAYIRERGSVSCLIGK
jgi:hypothetical protein